MGTTSHRTRAQQSARKLKKIMAKKIMAKKIQVDDVGFAPEKVSEDRQARWEAYVANYAKKNPVKYQAKKANGEFDIVPVSFV